jgi:membrane fusion protein, multidrug efflux system
MSRINWLALILICQLGCTGAPAKPAAPSEKPKVEADLAFTNLTTKQYAALMIKTEPVEVKEVQERLTLTGWIMAKPGHEVVLTAPAAGYVKFPNGNKVPIAGDRIDQGREVLAIDPVYSPVEQIQVDALKRSVESEFIKAQTTLKTAESDYERILDLYKQNLRSKQDFELATKARDHAVEDLAAAKDKKKLFDKKTYQITAPQGGTVLQTHVSPGQYVPASAPLVTIIDLNPVWLRVPVPEFDLPQVDPKASVEVTWKNASQNHADKPSLFKARPTGRVAQVDPAKHTADIWYELEATKDAGSFVKDQMVTARIPIGRTEKGVLVPYSALVVDTHGHSWIYLERGEKNGKHQFERHPVELAGSDNERVIVRASLKGGERVVVDGAGKLFSRDFYKTPIAEDD